VEESNVSTKGNVDLPCV